MLNICVRDILLHVLRFPTLHSLQPAAMKLNNVEKKIFNTGYHEQALLANNSAALYNMVTR